MDGTQERRGQEAFFFLIVPPSPKKMKRENAEKEKCTQTNVQLLGDQHSGSVAQPPSDDSFEESSAHLTVHSTQGIICAVKGVEVGGGKRMPYAAIC